jgi:hypothetical protein
MPSKSKSKGKGSKGKGSKGRGLDKGMLAQITGQTGETPLGHLGSAISAYEDWYSALIQIGHDDDGPEGNRHSPTCPEPVLRILKICKTSREARDSKIKLQKQLKGHIFEHKKHLVSNDNIRMPGFTLICKTLKRQCDSDYVWSTKATIEQQFWAHDKYIDDEFVSSMLRRNEGKRDEAIEEHRAYIRRYNKKGWVRFMRGELHIPKSITVIPGMHKEAEVMAKNLRHKGTKPPKILGEEESDEEEEKLITKKNSSEEKEEVDLGSEEEEEVDLGSGAEEEEEEEEEVDLGSGADEEEEEEVGEKEDEEKAKKEEVNLKFPASCRTRGQRYAAISFIMSDAKDMELLLYIHAVYPSKEAAQEDVTNNLDDRLKPLPIDVVDMYALVYPVRMLWEGSAMSERVVGMVETWAGDVRLGETQSKRLKATEGNRELKKDVVRRQNKEQRIIEAINERLDITQDVQDQLFSHFGSDKIKALCAIEDDDARNEKLQRYLKKMHETVPPTTTE